MYSSIGNNLTIVCASHHGSEKLPKLIKSICHSSVKPKEVIVCGTSDSDISLLLDEDIKSINLRFILSDVANQVMQRSKALLEVKTDYVLQLDDDLELEKSAIAHYCKHFTGVESENKVVCGYTVFPNGRHMSSRTSDQYANSLLVRFYLLFTNGFQQPKNMAILKSGRIFPYVLRNESDSEPMWLSSCLMYHKKVINEFFLFYEDMSLKRKGKSYYEDVFFTNYLYLKQYQLLLEKSAILTHPYTNRLSFRGFVETIPMQRELVRRSKGSVLLFAVDVVYSALYYLAISINEKRKKYV